MQCVWKKRGVPRKAGYSEILYPCTIASYRALSASPAPTIPSDRVSACWSMDSLLDAEVDEHEVSESVTCRVCADGAGESRWCGVAEVDVRR
jgi:hypothetical protein